MLQAESKRIAYHGIIHAIIKQINLTDRISQILPKKTRKHHLSHADAITAMIFNGLAFNEGRLYSASNFFKSMPLDDLFGKNISHKHINSYVLARALDAIYE